MLNDRNHLLAIDQEHMDIKRQGVSDWSPIVEVTVAGDELAPSAPSISASSADQAIDLVLTKPATNADGSTCVDFKEFKVYYSASSGIDITDPTSYDGYFYTPSTSHTYPATAKTYFVATAWDKNGNESAVSSEISAVPIASGYDPAVDDYTSNIANVYTGAGMIGIEFQPPKSSWIRFAGWKLYYDVDTGSGWGGTWTLVYTGSGPGFLHKGLNETYAYKYKLTVLGEDGTETAGTVSDNGGSGYTPNASDNSALLSVTIFAERMIATKEMITQTFIGGKLHSLNWGASAGTELSLDDEVIRLGGSGVGYDSGTGIWLGSDAGTYKLFIGDSAGNKVTWDGTTLAITGALTTASGSSIDGGYLTASSVTADKISVTNLSAINADLGTVTAGSIVVGSTNKLWLNDAADGSLAIGGTDKTTAPFRVDAAGNLTATSATISGAITTGSGSSLDGGYLIGGTVTYDKLNVSQLSAISADLGSITAGTITSAVYQTSGSYPNIVINDTSYLDTIIAKNASGNIAFELTTDGDITAYGLVQFAGTHCVGAFKGLGTYTNVFGPAAAPTAWTTLDLSGVVLSRGLVLLRVYNGGTLETNYRFRPYGDTVEQNPSADTHPGIFSTRVGPGYYNYVWVMTDLTNSYVEWIADQTSSTTIVVLAYLEANT